MERNGAGGGGGRLETELRLGLPGAGLGRSHVQVASSGSSPGGEVERSEKKRGFLEFGGGGGEEEGAVRKNQVVGWPPVAAFRRKNSWGGGGGGKMYVKVSMDGAPFLRKVDLDMHKGYPELGKALEELFGCFGIGEALKDEEEKCEYVPIYEDKDGDWMLLGDVPWEMFAESCKRLRIMKRGDANGSVGLHAKDLLNALSKEK